MHLLLDLIQAESLSVSSGNPGLLEAFRMAHSRIMQTRHPIDESALRHFLSRALFILIFSGQ